MPKRLGNYLSRNFGLEIIKRPLIGLWALLTCSHMGTDKQLVLNQEISAEGQMYFEVHAATHVLLGHSTPLTTVYELMPQSSLAPLSTLEANEHLQARVLTDGIIKGRIRRYWDSIWDVINKSIILDSVVVGDLKAEALELSTLVNHKVPRS